MEIIWVLILSVCNTDYCITQTISENTTQSKCINEKILHEELPSEGSWKSIEYRCELLNSVEV
tara:strand:- start:957 stop:1145 length:189 start_codon:yes stop_codon:yes gene_type:complete